MSEDSKNTFGSSVGVIQTRCKPLKVAASTVYYSIEAEKFLASKIAEMNFLLYKMMLLIPILKKLSFYLQKQKNFIVTQIAVLEIHVFAKIIIWVTIKNFLLLNIE